MNTSNVDYSKSKDIKKKPFAEQLTTRLKPYIESLVQELSKKGISLFDEYVKSLDKPEYLKKITKDLDSISKCTRATDVGVDRLLDEFDKFYEEYKNAPVPENSSSLIEGAVIANEGEEEKSPYEGKVTVLSVVASLRKAFNDYVNKQEEEPKEKEQKEVEYRETVTSQLDRVEKKTRHIDKKVSGSFAKTILKIVTFMFLGGWFFKWAWPGIKPVIKDLLQTAGITDVAKKLDAKLTKDFPNAYGWVKDKFAWLQENLENFKGALIAYYETIVKGIRFTLATLRHFAKSKEERVAYWKQAYLDAGVSPDMSPDAYSAAVESAQASHGFTANWDLADSQAALESIKMDYLSSAPVVAQISDDIFAHPQDYSRPFARLNNEYNAPLTDAVRSKVREADPNVSDKQLEDVKVWTNPNSGESYISNQNYQYITNINGNVKSNLHQ